MAFWKWSHTASSNAIIDSTVNWAEGMAPSAVNDSARAMMARLAEWRDDISGTIVTAGSATAYTLASNQGFDNFADMSGAMVAFVPHTTNGATVTFNVDGLGGKPLRLGPNIELQSGVLIQGTPYVATYNNSDGAFYLQGSFANAYGIPLGALLPYVGSSAPSSAFALPYGQAISRATYAGLFSLAGTAFGSGDGSTTFNLPDLRGRSIFGLNNMGGSAAGRISVAGGNFDGTVLGGTGGGQNHTLTTGEMPVHNHGITDPGHSHNVLARSFFDVVGGYAGGGGGGANNPILDTGTSGSKNFTVPANITGIAVNNAGSGNSHTILPPAMTLPFIMRVI